MRLTYRMTQNDDGYLAHCEELAVTATGTTPEGTIDALRREVEQRLATVEAVGPPSRPPPSTRIELVLAVEPERDPQGPGDSPAAEDV